MDWLDLLAVQGTLKSLLQHHSSKSSILHSSAFFIVQLSHPYMNTGKTIALTRWTFVDKIMSLLFNMLSRLVIAYLPRSKHLLISWLQSPSAVILEPQKNSLSMFPLFPHLFVMKWWDWMPRSLFFECWVLGQVFHSPLYFFFTFFHNGGVICVSEVIDISPGNLDSRLWFLQPSVSHDVLCIEVK